MLYANLKQAKSEEDVKDIYIKALGLKSYTKGLIDIRTNEIWFEAKDTGKHSSYAMFTQLLHYVQDALNKGENLPPFLAVIDTEKAALMKIDDVLPFLKKKTVKWGKSASAYPKEALDEVSAHIGTHFVSFKISTHEEEFIQTVKDAIKSGDIIRTQITPDNLKQVFDKWVNMIGREIVNVHAENYALLFFADIMHDGTVSTHANLPAELLHKNNAPVFSLEGKIGDNVKEGDLLAQIDPRIYSARVQADEANIKNLQAQLIGQHEEVIFVNQQDERYKELLKTHGISEQDFQNNEFNLKKAHATVAALEAQIEQVQSTLRGDKTNLGYTKIFASMDGTVVDQKARAGQTLNANQQTPMILQLAKLDLMTVRAQVAEADVMRLKPDLPVYFSTLGAGERRWNGTIQQILPTPQVSIQKIIYISRLRKISIQPKQNFT